MPIFSGIFGIDELRADIAQLRREVALLAQQNALLRQGQLKLGETIMANFTELNKAIADLGVEVGEVLDILKADADDQVKIDEATTKLTALKDALDAFTPEPPPTPEA